MAPGAGVTWWGWVTLTYSFVILPLAPFLDRNSKKQHPPIKANCRMCAPSLISLLWLSLAPLVGAWGQELGKPSWSSYKKVFCVCMVFWVIPNSPKWLWFSCPHLVGAALTHCEHSCNSTKRTTQNKNACWNNYACHVISPIIFIKIENIQLIKAGITLLNTGLRLWLGGRALA